MSQWQNGWTPEPIRYIPDHAILLHRMDRQGYRITLAADGSAIVKKPDGTVYTVAPDGSCDCFAGRRRIWCKHSKVALSTARLCKDVPGGNRACKGRFLAFTHTTPPPVLEVQRLFQCQECWRIVTTQAVDRDLPF